MSFGGLGNCPLCWDDTAICNCSQENIDAYYKKIEQRRKEIEDFNREKHKHPIQEAWDKYKEANMKHDTEFTIKCKMRTRWVPYFLGMLKAMQHLGSIGCSRSVTLYADGDGDFRPKFEWDENLAAAEGEKSELSREEEGYFFDAG